MLLTVLAGMAVGVSAQNVDAPKYGLDSVASVTNLSIYREAYKQWEASKFPKDGMSPEMVSAWRYVFLNSPRLSQFTYTNGEKIMDYFIRTDVKNKDAYIDTLNMLADTRAICFPNDPKTGASQIANIKAKKGYLMYTYNKDRYEEAYNVLKEAVELDITQIQVGFLDSYFRAAADMVNNGKAEKMTVIDVYQQLSDVLDDNVKDLAETETELLTAKQEAEEAGDAEAVAGFDKQIEKNEKNINNYKGVKNNIDNLFQPFASCEDLIKVFSAKMAENPDDVNLLKRITTILDKKDCTDSKLFLDASKSLYALEPSPESAYNIGIQLFKDKKYGESATYFEQATKASNNDRVYRAYRNLAMCYQNVGNYSKARDAARRAAQVDPTAGEPYLIIGMLYAESSKQFTGLDANIVFCAAVDKFQKAKAIDAGVADRANDLIRAYSQYFPKVEDIFFNDYNEGQTYSIGGWIGETTTIRARK